MRADHLYFRIDFRAKFKIFKFALDKRPVTWHSWTPEANQYSNLLHTQHISVLRFCSNLVLCFSFMRRHTRPEFWRVNSFDLISWYVPVFMYCHVVHYTQVLISSFLFLGTHTMNNITNCYLALTMFVMQSSDHRSGQSSDHRAGIKVGYEIQFINFHPTLFWFDELWIKSQFSGFSPQEKMKYAHVHVIGNNNQVSSSNMTKF